MKFAVPDNRSAEVRVEGDAHHRIRRAQVQRPQVRGGGAGDRRNAAASTPTATACASKANARSLSCSRRAPTTACSTLTTAQPRDPVAAGGEGHRPAAGNTRTVARAPYAGPPGAVPTRGPDSRTPAPPKMADGQAARAVRQRQRRRRIAQLEQLYFQYGRYLLIARRARARCPRTCRACGTTTPRRRGTPTTTSTSTCR